MSNVRFFLFILAQLFGQILTTDNLVVTPYKIQDGRHLKIVLVFNPKPNHHLYWWNSGDTGKPITFSIGFDRPPKQVYPILLSPPEIKVSGIATDYILKNEFIAVASADFDEMPERVSLALDYLICEETCIPETIKNEIDIEKLRVFPYPERIEQLNFPHGFPKHVIVSEGARTVFSSKEAELYFFPLDLTPDHVKSNGKNEVVVEANLSNLRGLLYVNKDGRKSYYKVGNWNIYPELNTVTESQNLFLLSILTAILAGIILNFMPCVLPVLALKTAKSVSSKSLGEDVAYVLGCSLTVTVLGAIVSGVFFTADTVGWGFQLQNPQFVAVINFVIIVGIFSFFGFIHIPGFNISLPETKNPWLSSIFLGIVVTLVALPCGAPFLATLLVDAGARSVLENVTLFLILGVTFGSFYTLVEKIKPFQKLISFVRSYQPHSYRILAMPIIATSLWLLHINENQQVKIVPLITSYGLGVWCLSVLQKNKKFFGLILLAGSLFFYSLAFKKTYKTPSKEEYGVEWAPYSENLIAKLKTEGKPFYLDFTADWCLTCKFNKILVFSDKELIDEMKKMGFVFVKADWTSGDKAVTRALEMRGQKAIPFTVIFKPDTGEIFLPTLLTPKIVRNAVYDKR
ncbi:MAG: thioredoxin family protein [Deltaproteobacteria bacterium]|nr:thioredoxin family protein [Deltaproteobacteria bacterium]